MHVQRLQCFQWENHVIKNSLLLNNLKSFIERSMKKTEAFEFFHAINFFRLRGSTCKIICLARHSCTVFDIVRTFQG